MGAQILNSDATNSNRSIPENIASDAGAFKAIGALPISVAAKYIATTMLVTGVRSAAELRAITGLSKTTVYRVLAEIYDSAAGEILAAIPISPESPAIPSSPASGTPAIPADGNETEKTVPRVPLAGLLAADAPRAPASIATRATKELPSEVSSNEDNITPSFPHASKTASKSKAKKGNRLDDEWELPEDWRQWALVNCPAASPDMVAREAMIFANYWQALSGAKACKLDWFKTWKNWALKAFGTGPMRKTSVPATNWYEDEARKRREFYELATGGALNG